jgi:NAD(P)-dependent dehydrogenase (short-subunit alcohol dehydrogenase family)
VVVNYARSHDAAMQVVAAIERAGGSAIAVRGDVSKPADVDELFMQTDRHFGRVTALINNAGIGGAIRPIEDHTEETLNELFRTNIYNCIYCAGAAIRRMSPRHGGSGGVIVNISSAAARLGGIQGMVAYAASKGAVDSFTTGLGKDGIRVVGIRPGMIATDILEPIGGATLMQATAPTIPLGRVGQAEEIAQAAIWLLSPAASYVHGTTIDVSGGR